MVGQGDCAHTSLGHSGRFRAVMALCTMALAMCGCTSKQNSADARLQAIYTEEWRWRDQQFPDSEDSEKPIQDHLPKVDPPTEEMRLRVWQEVLRKLDSIPRAGLSPAERLNYDVYRPQIETLIANQRFRDYEMPVNADTPFWTSLGYIARRPYRSVQDYRNWLAQMRDIPRYFREQIDEMRRGLRRGFTPPRVTLQGRDASLTAVTESAPEASLLYTPFREMPGIAEADKSDLRAQAIGIIKETVQPAYRELLVFMRAEYLPGTRTTVAASDLPDGAAYYRAKIREFTTVDRDPASIHAFGEAEVARLHDQMLAAMRETGFAGDFPAFLKFLRADEQFQAKTPQELLMRAAWIAKKFDGKASQFFGLLPRARFAIRPVPDGSCAFLYGRARGTGSVPAQHLRFAEPPSLQPHRPHLARVRARSRLPDTARTRTQASAGISPAHLSIGLWGRVGAVLRAAGTRDGDVRNTL